MRNVKGGEGFVAAPQVQVVHPWWYNGKRSYWRFWMWSVGDGALIAQFPAVSWRDWTPNSGEWMVASVVLLAMAGVLRDLPMFFVAVKLFLATVLGNVIHDAYRNLYRDRSRFVQLDSSLSGLCWAIAVLEGSLIRMSTELGRLVGIFKRGEWTAIGKRFDWFCGRLSGQNIREERNNGIQRMFVGAAVLWILGF